MTHPSPYDPRDDPRYIGSVESDVDEVEIARLNRVLSAFDSEFQALSHEGFRHTTEWLATEIEIAVKAMRAGRIKDMEHYAHVRGQIEAFEKLLNRRGYVEAQRKAIVNKLVEYGGMDDPKEIE